MEIGPILGVRAVASVKPDRLSPDLSRVFEPEYLGGSPDDDYTADDQDSEVAPEEEPGDEVVECGLNGTAELDSGGELDRGCEAGADSQATLQDKDRAGKIDCFA